MKDASAVTVRAAEPSIDKKGLLSAADHCS
eukprot:COSAG01_NODE_572_length_15298_cov_8.549172_13_plen_30_part_00